MAVVSATAIKMKVVEEKMDTAALPAHLEVAIQEFRPFTQSLQKGQAPAWQR